MSRGQSLADSAALGSFTDDEMSDVRFKWYFLGGYWKAPNGEQSSDPGQHDFPQARTL